MGTLKVLAVSCVILVAMAPGAPAQWPIDSHANMPLSTLPNLQDTPKIAATSNGGCYITWFDGSPGNFCLMMQRLNDDGVAMWQDQGLLISAHPQEEWLNDYGLAVDASDNAIVVFNDIRADRDRDIYAYKISPSGEFLWGPDGVVLSANNADELGPMVTIASDGEIVFAWPKATIIPNRFTIDLRRLTPAGVDVWQDPQTLEISAEYGLSIARLVPGESGSVILQALKGLDYGFGCPKDLVAYKIDSDGHQAWGDSGIMISNQGGFLAHMMPELTSDGAGGAYSYWYDGRFARQGAFVQHILPNGTMAWEANGLPVSTDSLKLHMLPELTRLPNSDNVIVFFISTDLDQTNGGIFAQMINPAGERVWSDTGVTLVPMQQEACLSMNALPQQDGAVVTYIQETMEMEYPGTIRAIKLNMQGIPVWPVSPETLAAQIAPHRFLVSTVNYSGQIISAWTDCRVDYYGDIYLQNINPDGTFGPYTTSVDDEIGNIPNCLTVHDNYPNPFNSSTIISYSLSHAQDVTIDILDILGRKIETLPLGRQQAGTNFVSWNADDKPSGAYFYRVQADNHTETRRMLYLK